MNSRPVSRLGKKVSNQELNPGLKLKIEALEGKYNEFINNCSTFLQDDPKARSEAKINLSPEKIDKRRESFNEYHKEVLKLRRENSVLIKTVENLSSRITSLEKEQVELIVDKQFEGKSESNRKTLHKQEHDILAMNQELNKSRANTGKTKFKDSDSRPIRSSTPGVCKKTQKVGTSVYKYKEFNPIFKERMASPISRSVSPKDRVNYSIKKEISNLKTELEQVKEERNLYKSWKDYCSNHPPVPPAIHSIINHYEIEINQLKTLNSVIKSRSDSLAQAVTYLLKDLERTQGKKNGDRDLLESLKSQVRNKIKELQQYDRIDTPVAEDRHIKGNKLMKGSAVKLEEENKNLQEILRREKTLADILVEAIKIKSEENFERKNTMGMFSTSDRFGVNSIAKASESISENHSAVDTPYSSRYNLEMSFNSRDKVNSYNGIKEIIEVAERIASSAFENVSKLTNEKIRQVGLMKTKISEGKERMQQKVKLVEDKWKKELSLVMKLRDTLQKYEEIHRNQAEKIGSGESLVVSLQQEIDRNRETQAKLLLKLNESENELERIRDLSSFHEEEMNNMADTLNSKDKEIDSKREIINKYEDEKRILNEKILSLKKENDFIRKGNEADQAKLQAQKDSHKLKDLQEKLQVTQIRLSELELIHKATEQELKESYKQLQTSQVEAESIKREIQEEFYIIIEQKEKANSISQQLMLDEIESLKESHGIELENIQKQSKKELLKSMEQLKLARNQTDELRKTSREEIEAVLKESERALSSLSRQIKAQKEGKDSKKTIQEEIESIRKESEFEISMLSEKLIQTKNESDSEKRILKEEIETIRKESNTEILKIQKQLRNTEDKSEEEKKSLQEEIDSIHKSHKLALSELSQQLIQNENESENVINGLKVEIESNIRESELKLFLVSEELRNLKIESESQITKLQTEIEAVQNSSDLVISKITDELNSSRAKYDKQKIVLLEEIQLIRRESDKISEELKITKIAKENEKASLDILLESLRNDSELKLSKLSEELALARAERDEEKRTLQEEIESIRAESDQAISVLSEKLKIQKSESEYEKSNLQESFESLLRKSEQDYAALSAMLEKQKEETEELTLSLSKFTNHQSEYNQKASEQENLHKSTTFDMVFENSFSIFSDQNTLSNTSNKPEVHSASDLIEMLSSRLNLEIDMEAINNIISQYQQIEPLCDKIKELEEKNKILETVYKKLTEDVKMFQENYKEKIEDLKLDKYELEKELDEQKKRFNITTEEIKKIKDELQLSEQGRKELSAQRNESENVKSKLIADLDEKSKKIAELNLELLNSNNYAQKLVKEKDLMEREKSNLARSVSSK